MARTRWDIGSSRFGLADDLNFIPIAKMILTSQPVVGLGWKTVLVFHYLARFLHSARILSVMVRTRQDLASSRYGWIMTFSLFQLQK
jgi:hypothetical protein